MFCLILYPRFICRLVVYDTEPSCDISEKYFFDKKQSKIFFLRSDYITKYYINYRHGQTTMDGTKQ